MTITPVPKPRPTWLAVVAVVVSVLLLAGLVVGGASGCKAWNRYQKRADAVNNARVAEINLIQYDALIEQEKRRAEIKHQQAIGQRQANEEVAARLTPLFVQYEMIQSMEAIATSGTNNTVIYIPAGANGVPLVSTTNQPQVFGGDATPTEEEK